MFLSRIIQAIFIVVAAAVATGTSAEVRSFQLEPQWQTDPEEPPFFRSIDKVLQASNGDFLVFDYRSSTCHRYSSTGEHVDLVVFGGEGPGEAGVVCDVAIDKNDQIYLYSPFGPAVIDMEAQWRHKDGLSRFDIAEVTQSSSMGFTLDTCEDDIVLSRLDYKSEAIIFELASPPWYESLREIFRTPTVVRFQDLRTEFAEKDLYYSNYPVRCVLGDTLFVASAWSGGEDEYRIDAYAGGNLVGSFCGAINRTRRSEAQVRRAKELMLGGAEGVDLFQSTREVIMEDYPPDILSVTRQGNTLWVRSSADIDSDDFRSYSVFGANGRYLWDVLLRCRECDKGRDRVYLFGSQAVVIKGMVDLAMSSPRHPVADASPLQIRCFMIAAGADTGRDK